MRFNVIRNTASLGDHWFSSTRFETNDYAEDLDQGVDEVTSVPSPFARFDIIKTSFIKEKERIEEGNKQSKAADNFFAKTISQTLDIAQIFHNFKKFEKMGFEIVKYKLKEVDSMENDLLKNTLDMFLTMDQRDTGVVHTEPYKESTVYFLKIHEKIVGGLNPMTLFFSTADAAETFKNLDIEFSNENSPNNQLMAFKSIAPLHHRRTEFIAFLKFLSETRTSEDRTNPTAFIDYVHCCLQQLKPEQQQKVQALYTKIKEGTAELEPLTVNQNPIKYDAFEFLQRNPQRSDIGESSDFGIRSEKFDRLRDTPQFKAKYQYRPLVLRRDLPSEKNYADNKSWDDSKNKDLQDRIKTPIPERTLPGLQDNYPYLVACDFLADYLLQVDYPLNENLYWLPNVTGTDSLSFLFPLKPLFFDFFDAEQAREMLELNISNRWVYANLNIPVGKGNDLITLSRTYNLDTTGQAVTNNSHNAMVQMDNGNTVLCNFALSAFPSFSDPEKNLEKRVFFAEAEQGVEKTEYSVTLAKAQNGFSNLENQKTIRRLKRTNQQKIDSVYIDTTDSYDLIHIKRYQDLAEGMILPKFRPLYENYGDKKAIFGIDLGTSNTHVHMFIGDPASPGQSPSEPFHVPESPDSSLLANFHASRDKLSGVLQNLSLQEFIPNEIVKQGSSQTISYPHKTVLSKAKHTSANTDLMAAGETLIDYYYGKKPSFETIEQITELKWEKENRTYLEKFLEQLMLQMKTKATLERIKLENVEFIVTYPSSMTTFEVNNLNTQIWQKLKNRYFPENSNKVRFLSESLAPYYTDRVRSYDGENAALNVDIGGGTTDIVAFKSEKPVFSTSVKFAATSLFGAGFPRDTYHRLDTNGYTKKYLNEIEKNLAGANTTVIKEIFENIKETGNATQMIELWLAMGNDETIRNYVNFSEMLSAPGMHRVPFLIFYVAILYFLANAYKVYAPGNKIQSITFSGMGSKTIKLLTSDDKTLLDLAKVVFSSVTDVHPNFKITFHEAPKQVTAEGAVEYAKSNRADVEDLQSLNKVMLGSSPVSTSEDKNDLDKYRYEGFEKSAEFDKVLQDITEFYNFLFDTLPEKFNFEDRLGFKVSEFKHQKEQAVRLIKEDLMKGVNDKQRSLESDDGIEETMFFFPITLLVNRLALELNR